MIGLIFGESEFPKYILRKIKKKLKYTIIDLTKKKIFQKNKKLPNNPIGKFIVSFLSKKKIYIDLLYILFVCCYTLPFVLAWSTSKHLVPIIIVSYFYIGYV